MVAKARSAARTVATAAQPAPQGLRAAGGATALLVIDLQQGLFERGAPVYGAETLLDTICRLTERARAAGAPVVYVQHCNDSFLAKRTPGWDLHPRLAAAPGDLRLEKHHSNAFEDTPLQAELARLDVGTVVITGLVTHGCVKAACEGALALGYRVVLAEDGHSSFAKDAREKIALWNRQLADKGVVVKPAAGIDF